MSFFHLTWSQKLERLKKISKKDLAGVLASQAAQAATKAVERVLYTQDSAPQSPSAVSRQSLHLIHSDVLTAGFSQLFQEQYPQETKTLLARADQSLNLVFDVLGSGPVDLKEFRNRTDLKTMGKKAELVPARAEGRLPWHFDFKSGLGWDPHLFFADVRFGQQPGMDVKVPWELSRCHHFVWLGQAYRLTQNEAYAKGFMNQAEDWIEQNPVKYGVNWSCPMEVALRAGNWLVALDLFFDSPSLHDGFRTKIHAALYAHGDHIRRHLEKGGGSPTNHYLTNLLGLSYLGQALGVEKWRILAQKEMTRQIEKQVHPDGVDYEASTAYHRFGLEIFFYFALLQSRSGSKEDRNQKLGSPFLDRLRSMVLVTQKLARPDGSLPLIGDNDSGRVHDFYPRPDADARFAVNAVAALLKEFDLKIEGWEDTPELVWLYGFSGMESFRALPGKKPDTITSKPPQESGLVVLRGPNDHVVFSAQPNGTNRVGNHTHNDKLSLTLSVQGVDYFIDPGMPVYTADPTTRDLFRSTRSHNTVEVDGEEQNRFLSAFMCADDAQIHIKDYKDGQTITAAHTGYERGASPVLHTRTIERKEELEWVLTDEFQGSGEHTLKWSFVLGPTVQPQSQEEHTVLLSTLNHKQGLRLKSDKGTFQWEEGHFSSAYGVVHPTKILRLSLTATVPFTLAFHLKEVAI